MAPPERIVAELWVLETGHLCDTNEAYAECKKQRYRVILIRPKKFHFLLIPWEPLVL